MLPPVRVRIALAVGLALTLAGCTSGSREVPESSRAAEQPSTAPPATATPRQEWTAPGLVDAAGSPVEVPLPAPVTGRSISAADLGADPAPGSEDDAAPIRRAIAEADPGDEVVLPAGVFDLRSTDADDPAVNVVLRSGVAVRGAGVGRTVLLSYLDDVDDSAVLRGAGVHDVTVADLTVTSRYDGPLGVDPEETSGGGPMYGIHLRARGGEGSSRVLVQRVHVERFQRHGISIKGSREVTVTDCLLADATSVGPGGSGYGVAVEGLAGGRDPGAQDDARHNVVTRNRFLGEHLRHAILLQFPTHNNLVADNSIEGSVLDAIDLHGEGEYLNEIRGNVVEGGTAAAIALGNSGGAKNKHDASGWGNWVHGNVLTDNRQGVLVILGTPQTLIENNEIIAGEESRSGIEVRNGPGTVVRANSVVGGSSEAFWAIRLLADGGADGRGEGVPRDVRVEGNAIMASANGIRVDAGDGIVLADNTITGVRGGEQRLSENVALSEK